MSAIETDSVIDALAGQAGAQARPLPFGWVLAAAGVISFAAALALAWGWIGLRADFADYIRHAPFQFKLAGSLLLAAGGVVLVWRAALPGRGRLTPAVLLPGLLLLAYRAATDTSGLPVMGHSSVSVEGCVGAILELSVPALALTLAALRIAAPTRPGLAGALAGLLAGSLGAAAYALACTNDAGLFVVIWYPVAILIMAGLGAVIGRRFLAW